MPEPNYADGDPPGFWVFLGGTVLVVILFLLVKSCMGGG